jgi:hypothetical protein
MQRKLERSFTLFEVIIAILITTVMMVELVGLQGNVVYFHEYGDRLNKASYLAKRVMSQVEYHWQTKDFKELSRETDAEVPFRDEPDFRYKLRIIDWKLPLVEMLSGMDPSQSQEESGEEGTEGGAEGAGLGSMGSMLKQVIGDDLLKVAHVEVIWAEGASKNSAELTMLLTNQKKLDQLISQFKPTAPAPTPPTGPRRPSGTQGQPPIPTEPEGGD